MAALLGFGLVSCGGGSGNETSAADQQEQNAPSAPSSSVSGAGLPLVQLRAGTHLANAEVASTREQREQGLMSRRQLAENDGMLFVYPEPVSACMWMMNTFIPLSVAFIDQNGIIVNIEDMEPQTTGLHCSRTSVRYALEMNRGWFSRNNVLPGSTINGLP